MHERKGLVFIRKVRFNGEAAKADSLQRKLGVKSVAAYAAIETKANIFHGLTPMATCFNRFRG